MHDLFLYITVVALYILILTIAFDKFMYFEIVKENIGIVLVI